MTQARLVNALASLLISVVVAVVLVLLDAPTWGWVGICAAVYLNEIKTGPRR